MTVLNILDNKITNFLSSHPDATFQGFKEVIRRNFPNQYRFLQRELDKYESKFNEVKTKINETTKQISDTGNKIKQQQPGWQMATQEEIDNLLGKQENKFISTGKEILKKAGKAAKGVGRVAAPVAAISDIPRAINTEVNKDNSRPLQTWGNRIQGTGDVLTSLGLTGKVPLQVSLGVGGILQGTGAGLQAIDKLINEGVGNEIKNNPVKGDPNVNQEIIDAYNLIQDSKKIREQGAQELAKLEALDPALQQQMADNQEAMQYFADFDNRMNKNIGNLRLNNQQLNAIAGPRSSINYSSGTSYPITNLTPVNVASTSSDNNLPQPPNVTPSNNQPPAIRNSNSGAIQNLPINNVGIMDNNQIQFNNNSNDLLNRINLISSIYGGAQSGNQLPDLGVSNEQLAAIQQQLSEYGKNISGALSDIDMYKKALEKDKRNQAIATGLDIGANVLGRMTSTPVLFDVTGRNFIGDRYMNMLNQMNGGQNKVGSSATPTADYVAKMLEVNQKVADLSKQQWEQRAKLIGAAEISNATGLPLNVTMSMEPSDYFGYLKEIQTANRELSKQGLSDVGKLAQDVYQQAADYQKAIDQQRLINQGDLTQEQLKQYGAGTRLEAQLESQAAIAQMENNIKAMIANADNATKLKVTQMVGENAQALERLKQSDPNAYYRALGSLGQLLESGVYMSSPQANELYNQLVGNLLNDIQNNTQPLSGKQQAAKTFADTYKTD